MIFQDSLSSAGGIKFNASDVEAVVASLARSLCVILYFNNMFIVTFQNLHSCWCFGTFPCTSHPFEDNSSFNEGLTALARQK
jgi:hypothetical protein